MLSGARPKLKSGSGRRRISPLTLRILAINIMALALLLAGLLYLDQYRDGLIEAKTESLEINGTIIAGALGESAGIAANGVPVLNPAGARTMVRRLVSLTGTRARLFGERGALLADSQVLISAGREVEAGVLVSEISARPGLLRRTWDHASEALRHIVGGDPDLPLYHEARRQRAGDFSEVEAALVGRVVSKRRVSVDGEIIVSVALPVQHFKKILGALLLSAGTADVEAAVGDARLAIFSVFVAALAVTILLSLYLAGSISQPLHHLAEAAEAVRRRPGHRERIPDLSARNDEIGDLSAVLRDMTGALYDRLDAIEGFAADVAHEIRNPLTSIKSAVEVLARGGDAAFQARLIAIIEDDVRRLDRLIGDISDASRLDAELARAEFELVNLISLCETLIDISGATAGDDGPDYILEIEPGIEIEPGASRQDRFTVPGLESRLGQVLRNLLVNAATFSPPGGTVRIRLIFKGQWVHLSVEDDGPGIPRDKLDAVFDRFYTERPEQEAFGEHSGLGLSISRQIVDAHDGIIRVENRTNDDGQICGARFVVELRTTLVQDDT
jgi:two-component system sensor histidine kinase ChvG